MTIRQLAETFFVFTLAGLCEIAGGYLIWQWLREGKSIWLALGGLLLLTLFGVVLTYQPANFGRAYAAYGGAFICLAILWGWLVDHQAPDLADLLGSTMALLGMGVILFWPRH